MRTWSRLFIAVLLPFAWASWTRDVGAQTLDRPGTGFTGTVASADSFALVVRADNGKLVTFPVNDPFRVPAGLVPGTRVTVRYEVEDGRYRLVGVKIASGPMEHDSTTEPPSGVPAPAPEPDAIRQEPGRSPVLPEPQPEPEEEPPTPEPTVGAAVALPADATVAPGSPARPSPSVERPQAREAVRAAAQAAAAPGSREIATLLTLLLASGALLWLALARL